LFRTQAETKERLTAGAGRCASAETRCSANDPPETCTQKTKNGRCRPRRQSQAGRQVKRRTEVAQAERGGERNLRKTARQNGWYIEQAVAGNGNGAGGGI